MVVSQNDAVTFDEIEESRHLLEVGGHVRVVTRKMNVIELNVDDVFDVSARRTQTALAIRVFLPSLVVRPRLGLCLDGKETQRRWRHRECNGYCDGHCFTNDQSYAPRLFARKS